MKRIANIFLLICMLLFSSGCGNKDDESVSEVTTNVTVFDVIHNDISSEVKYTGEIKAEEEAMVSPKTPGVIQAINVDIGTYVNAGDVLAVLDDTDYRIAYNQALAAYNSATNGSALLNQNQLEATVSAAQIEYNNAYDNYNRQKALYEAGGISKVAFETAEIRLKNAEINLNSSKKSYEITVNNINVDTEKSAKAALDSATNNLNNTVIKAPISGYIASKNATIGQMAVQGSPIFVIKATDIVNAEVSVTESVIPYITIDTKASVSIDSAGFESIEGTVSNVSAVKNDTTGMYTVKIMIENPENKIKVGMFADITLETESVENALVIPNDAVMQSDEEYYVYVAKDGISEKRTVITGITDDEYVQIVKGLEQGETVIVSGKEYLSEKNNKIKIVEEQ